MKRRSTRLPLPPAPPRLHDDVRPAVADLPQHRVDALITLALRTVVPIVGVLCFGQDVQRLAALYFVDTWLALSVTLGLLAVCFTSQVRESPSLVERINGYAGAWLVGALIATFVMIAAGFPLLWFVSDWRELLADETFLGLLLSHVAASVVAFVRQAALMPTDESEAIRLRHRFEFIFLRWIGVYIVLMVLAPMVTSLWSAAPAYLLVFTYCTITIAAELAPERVRNTVLRLVGQSRRPYVASRRSRK